jgi:hypothetical protein
MKRGAVPWRRIRYKYLRPASVWAETDHSLCSTFARPSSESCQGCLVVSATPRRRCARSEPCSTASCTPTAASPRRRRARPRRLRLRSRRPVAPNASKSGRERVIERARRDNLTVRQLAQIPGSYGGLALVGTPKMIADQMEEWLYSDACDGFNIMFPRVPGGLDDFVDRVAPELQRRNLFRREYEGKTLRENLGLPRPENRFFGKRVFRPDRPLPFAHREPFDFKSSCGSARRASWVAS